MALHSFDIVSDYDKAEMNNVIDQAKREIANRYDFKNTPANVEFADSDKTAIKIIGNSKYQLESILDILRKKAASRGISQKVFDPSSEPEESNLKLTWIIKLKSGLDQDKAKQVNKLLREHLPKIKTQVQGESIRVFSAKKDELQQAMQILKEAEFNFPLSFTNFR